MGMKLSTNKDGGWFGDWQWGDERITVKLDPKIPIEGLEKVLSDRLQLVLTELFENGDVSLGGEHTHDMSFPAAYGDDDGQGNPPPSDPLTIYYTVWFNPDVPTSFKFSLRDMVNDAIWHSQDDGKVSLEIAGWFRQFADELQGEVDRIRKVIP